MAESKASFAAIPPRAIADKRMTLTHFRVLAAVALVDRMSASKGAGIGCDLGYGEIAKRAGVSPVNASSSLVNMVAWGFLAVIISTTDKRRKIYRVLYNASSSDEVVMETTSPTDEVTAPDTSRRDEALPDLLRAEKNKPETIQKDKTPSIEVVEIKKVNKRRAPRDNYSEDFLAFCGRYPPNKVSRVKIEKAWRKVEAELPPLEIHLACIDAYVADVTADRRKGFDKQFQYPTTWLNNRCWEPYETEQAASTAVKNAPVRWGEPERIARGIHGDAEFLALLGPGSAELEEGEPKVIRVRSAWHETNVPLKLGRGLDAGFGAGHWKVVADPQRFAGGRQ